MAEARAYYTHWVPNCARCDSMAVLFDAIMALWCVDLILPPKEKCPCLKSPTVLAVR